MIARLSKAGTLSAEMDDEGVWTGDDANIVEALNTMYNPNEERCRRTGDHHLGYGRACAGRVANELGFDIEFGPQEELPDGAIS